jgi:phosphatidylglycerophosphate synthase
MDDHPSPTAVRRPIAARSWRFSQRVANRLARCGISPNLISVASMVFGIVAGAALAATSWAPSWAHVAWIAGAALIQLRLLANMFDGMVAVETGKSSPLGEIYNELPDRFSDVATLVGAGYAAGGNPTLGFLAACMAVLVAYMRTLGKGAGAPSEFCGPMAKQQRMAIVTCIAVYCGVTPVAWQPIWGTWSWGLMAIGLLVIFVGGLVTLLRRLARIAANLRSRSL